MRLTKMHGLGNDYLFLNALEDEAPDHLSDLARQLSDRHFGVGADGLICVKPGQDGDFTMEMYNADGSRGAMCGNGIRCLGKYVYDRGLTRKRCLTIDTDAGSRGLELSVQGTQVVMVTVDMGKPYVSSPCTLETEDARFSAIPVQVGNPHAVFFLPDLSAISLELLGPRLEAHPMLPEPSNLEFVTLSAPDRLTVRVWERGSGITLACGTGACAAFAAARRKGICQTAVSVRLPGGTLWVEEQNQHLFLTGPAVTVFDAEIPDR